MIRALPALLLPLLLACTGPQQQSRPTITTSKLVVVETPFQPSAEVAPPAPAPAEAAVAAPSRPRQVPTPAPPVAELASDFAEQVSRAMVVVAGPAGGLEIRCGDVVASGTRSARIERFPAGTCDILVHGAAGVSRATVELTEPVTVQCDLTGAGLSCR